MLDHLVFDLDFETYNRAPFEDPKLCFWKDVENKFYVTVCSSVSLNVFEILSVLINMILNQEEEKEWIEDLTFNLHLWE